MRQYAAFATAILTFFVSLSQAQDTNSTLVISEDGNCGGTTGQTCLGSSFGNCCSGKGYCGSTTDYCNAECQDAFGSCTANADSISTDGRCGTTDPLAQICIGSSFGNCCSETGWCGGTDEYCATGCQGAFGDCGANNTSSSSATSASSSSPATTSSSSTSSRSSSTSTNSGSTTIAAAAAATTSADNDNQAVKEMAISNGTKAGIGAGVGVGVAAVLLAAFIIFRRRRRSARKAPSAYASEIDEKGDFNTTPSTPERTAHAYPVKQEPTMANELDAQRTVRAELGGNDGPPSLAGSTWKGSQGHVVELPSDKP